MPINEQHLLGLLADILKNQDAPQYLSPDEQQQIQQLSSQLLQLGMTDDQLINTLQTIQQNQYDTSTTYTNENVQKWISVIDQNLYS